MKVSITYCTMWNYLPDATRVAAEIKKDTGTDVELIPGKGGIFDVRVDGKVIYSKENTGRFPKPGEVTALMKQPQA